MSTIKPKECQKVEFKHIWKDEYLKWICGFANAQGAVMYWTNDVLENGLETSASLATHFKVDERTIRRDLSVLQTKGFIHHDGPDKGGRWVVIKG